MDIGLVMLVKDETRRLEGALGPILDQLAQVIVIDTGSTDGTPDLLREKLGIEPLFDRLDPRRCGSHADLRNRGLAMLDTPWRMTLDADERLSPEGLKCLRGTPPGPEVGGIFLRWKNFLENGDTFDDYKCVFFRRGIRKVGLIHDNVQPSLRRHGTIATWCDAVYLEHRPEACKDAWKRRVYRERLDCAMRLEPDNPRYPWFAGYAALQQGQEDDARDLLNRAADSDHPLFPVERLNARVALVALAAQRGDVAAARSQLAMAAHLFDTVRDDFEIRINHWLEPWLQSAAQHLAADDPGAVTAPRFAC